jgi:integrase
MEGIRMSAEITFHELAHEWWKKFMLRGDQRYAFESWRRLEREVLPELGQKPLGGIEAPMILAILRRVEARGTIETAYKIKAHISQIMRYGIGCGFIYVNPARDLTWALTPKKPVPRAALTTPKEIGQIMAGIDRMKVGQMRSAFKLLALTFVRSGELLQAEWADIQMDMDAAEWRIPAAKMKMRRAHIVPLSRQALETLLDLRARGNSGRWLFPALCGGKDAPMTASGLRRGLRRLGYASGQMCLHGFRAMAATALSEQGWASEVIERQLAHVDRNTVRAAYQRSELLADRRRMMQAWADYLDMRCAWAILHKG